MDMVRKHCARCNGGIYTSWRSLDNKKYYHPHCFTCADCGAIIESVQEYGAASAKEEIYCGRCHNERFGIGSFTKNDKTHADSGLRTATVVNASSGSIEYCFKRIDDNDDNNNVNILYSSPSPFLIIRDNENFIKHEVNGAIRNTKKKLKARNKEPLVEAQVKPKGLKKRKNGTPSATEESSSTIGAENVVCEQKRSRIPRPTSAQARKSQTAALPPTNSKTTRKQLDKANKSSTPQNSQFSSSPARKLVTPAPKMLRSISLVQARNQEKINVGSVGNSSSLVPSNTKSNRSSSQSRPRSALTSAHEEKSDIDTSRVQQKLDNQCIKTSASKRQCAASFSTRRKKSSNFAIKQQAIKNIDKYQAPFPDDGYLQLQYKGTIPSTQAILTAIRREGSADILKRKSSSRIQLTNSDSYDIPQSRNTSAICPMGISTLPKRSFNMTFECPICISSLVPGSNNNEKGCSGSGTSQCPNVVTPCGHLFHGNCMDNWLKIKGNKRCPICSALCLPETLQPVYLESNLCADLNPKSTYMHKESNGFFGLGMNEVTNASFRTLRSEYDLLKAKYNAVLAENHNYSLNVTLANSLQKAYEMECRNRLQLQWENRQLLMKIEELHNSNECTPKLEK